MTLRVYADTNSVNDGAYWRLIVEGQRLDQAATRRHGGGDLLQ